MADNNGRFMIRNQDFTNGWADPETIFRVSAAIEEPYKRARFKTGDLLITIVGAGIGNVGMIPDWLDGANTTQNIARIAVDSAKAHPSFVAAVLSGPIGRRCIEYYSKGAAQPSLNLGHLRGFVVTVPPLGEQHEIATFLESIANPIDTLLAEATRAIELLQERRIALISAAVTGQIDVRHQSRN
jgi:type I restriction enzyme S subunit